MELYQNPVQQKLPCLFEISVNEGTSNKRPTQNFRVEATDTLSTEATHHDLDQAWVSEKVDGTCCYVAPFQGSPWLWARLDRKPNKVGDKKCRAHQSAMKKWMTEGKSGPRPVLELVAATDCKTVPENWIPASKVPLVNGEPQPDAHGHTPGWVPVELKSRQHMWHLTPVDLKRGLALVLRESGDEEGGLVVECVQLATLCGKTLELIGTNVNNNPYGLGSKQSPVHLLVVHGSIASPQARDRQLNREQLMEFFQQVPAGQVEGLVWHCQDGALFKVHRQHLGLPWPVPKPLLCERAVRVQVDPAVFEASLEEWRLFQQLSALHSQTLPSIQHLHLPLEEQAS